MKSSTLVWIGVGSVVLVSVLVATLRPHSAGHTLTAPSTAHVQAVTAQDLMNLVQSHVHKPRVIAVNFWASWCEPCKQEFPSLLRVRNKFAAQGLELLFVSLDEPRDLPAAEEFLKNLKVDFQTYYKGNSTIDLVSEIYPRWEGSIPTTILFGANAKVLDAWEGDTSEQEFETRIERQLKGT